MDPGTLKTIRRSNIKLEKYDALAGEFRRAQLPLYVDVMMGLPGSTITSFSNDLQECVDREVRARVFPTQLLVNSPMNEPEYRIENKIETLHPISASWDPERTRARPALVVSSASFTRSDYEEMRHIRVLFLLCENYGVARHLARYVRHEKGMREIDFYRQLEADARADADRWTITAFTLDSVRETLVPPASWKLLIDELRDYAVDVLGIADDPALDTVLAVQHALLPARDRRFPTVVELDHDYVQWFQAMSAAKHAGNLTDWPAVVPPLRSFGPGTLTVEDPHNLCEQGIGFNMEQFTDSDWEFDSPVSRPTTRRQVHL
jgi:hypothetical protein